MVGKNKHDGRSFGLVADFEVAARDGQRAIDRTPALESRDELLGLRRARTAKPERQLDLREHRHTGMRLPLAVDGASDRDGHAFERDLRVAGKHLEDLGSAGGGSGEQELSRSRRLAGTTVLDRTVHGQAVLADGATHPPEGGGGLRVRLVDAHSGSG